MSPTRCTGETARRVSVMIQDHPSLFRDAFVNLLSHDPGVSVTAVVESHAEVFARAVETPPDVIFLEIPPDPSGVARLRQRWPELALPTRVVGIGRSSDRQHVGALCAGPLPRTAPFTELLRAAGITGSDHDPGDRPPELVGQAMRPLTGRELQILSLLKRGQTTVQISGRLQLSTRAVRASRERLLAKLEAQSTAQALTSGIGTGLESSRNQPESRGCGARPGRSYRPPQALIHKWENHGTRVIVAHEMPVVAPALRVQMRGEAQILFQTASGDAAALAAEILAPHVIVASDVLADGVIEQHLPRLTRWGALVLVVIRDEDPDGAYGVGLLRQGARGVISFRSSVTEVARAVILLSSGHVVVPGATADRLLLESEIVTAAPGIRALTGRELEVLEGMTEGLGAKAIARRLGVAGKTVENTKTRIFQKLGVRSHAEAVAVFLSGYSRPREAGQNEVDSRTYIRPNAYPGVGSSIERANNADNH